MITHTPGPWKVFTSTDGQKLIGVGATNGQGITDSDFGIWSWDDPEGKANALLIAAAPDLLAALKRLLAGSYKNDAHKQPCGCPVCESYSVVAKAEGRS
jgi:hypothetical protein